MDDPCKTTRMDVLYRAWEDAAIAMSPSMQKCVDVDALLERAQTMQWVSLLETRQATYIPKARKVKFPMLGTLLANDVARALEWQLTAQLSLWSYSPQAKPRAIEHVVSVFRSSFVHHLRLHYPEHKADFEARTRVAAARKVLCVGMSDIACAELMYAAWSNAVSACHLANDKARVAEYEAAVASSRGVWVD